MTWDDVHDSRAVFRSLLAAICAPARPTLLPQGFNTADETAQAVVATLVDPGVTIAAPAGWPVPPAAAAPAPVADFVVFAGDPGTDLAAFTRGTPGRPESGATVVIIGESAPTRVRVAGPGIEAPFEAALPLTAAALAARAQAVAAEPYGIDVFVCGPGRVWALPRSTRIDLTTSGNGAPAREDA